jgi:hypothetical protein
MALPEFYERRLHDVFGISGRGEPLAREEQELCGKFSVTALPGFLGNGGVHRWAYRLNAIGPSFCARNLKFLV